MLYERSFQIENRLRTVLRLIETAHYWIAGLAEVVGVSVPTISRDVLALRERGCNIRAECAGERWHYVLIPHVGIDESSAFAGLAGTGESQLAKRMEKA